MTVALMADLLLLLWAITEDDLPPSGYVKMHFSGNYELTVSQTKR